jgi:hypothetical protein
VTRVGFEPTPMKTTALTLRLRPLGHRVNLLAVVVTLQHMIYCFTIPPKDRERASEAQALNER